MRPSFAKILLHLEGFAIFVGSVVAYRELGDSWGKFFLLFLAPDLSMLGYLASPSIGSKTYNLFHYLLWSIPSVAFRLLRSLALTPVDMSGSGWRTLAVIDYSVMG